MPTEEPKTTPYTLPPLDGEIEQLFGAPVKPEPSSTDRVTGQILGGEVVESDDEFVYVKLDPLEEGEEAERFGRCPRVDAAPPTVEPSYSPGDRVTVRLEEPLDDERWLVSIDKARVLGIFNELKQAAEQRRRVKARVNVHIRGGFSADVDGIRAFVPGRESGVPRHAAERIVGETLEFEVKSFDESRGEPVLTRKAIAAKEMQQQRDEALARLEEGETYEGTVTRIERYGAFVDLGGVEGLLHISEYSDQHVNDPSMLFGVGDTIAVRCIGIDRERGRIKLSRREIAQRRRKKRLEGLEEGQRVSGIVRRLTDFGAFIEIAPGIEGLCHVSELSWTERPSHPSEILETGQEVEVAILSIEPEDGRVSLSLRALEENPWASVEERFPIGETVTGTITRIEDYGLFVALDDEFEGLAHISELVWEGRPERPTDVEPYETGQTIDVKVVEIEPERGRIGLSVKQLTPDPWEAAGERLEVGATYPARVTRFADNAAHFELAPGVEGRMHISQVSTDRIESIRSVLRVGQEVEVMTVGVDRGRRRIDLSIRAIEEREQAQAVTSFHDDDSEFNPLAAALQRSGLVGAQESSDPVVPGSGQTGDATADPPSNDEEAASADTDGDGAAGDDDGTTSDEKATVAEEEPASAAADQSPDGSTAEEASGDKEAAEASGAGAPSDEAESTNGAGDESAGPDGEEPKPDADES